MTLADAALAAEISLPVRPSWRVLVIDDNTDTLHLYERALADSRYTCLTCGQPQHAVAQAAEVRPHIIMLDVMMPDVDGWELLGRLRTHPALQNTPIIISSILPQEQLARTLGAAAFLRKPFNRVSLLAVLDQRLMGKEPDSAP
jgi:DNA-binding response OmpR family regulator